MSERRRAKLSWTVALLALAVGGCGGGGGRVQPTPLPPVVNNPPAPPVTPPPPPSPPPAPTPTPPPPPPTGINFDDAEYRRSNGAVASGAITAYNVGATGQGVTIAVVDSGINPNLPEFSGKIAAGSGDLVAQRGVVDNEGHGTAVSAVAAAARNGQDTFGVAFGASILSLNTADPNDCGGDDGCKHPDSAIAAAVERARQNGARVINISLGGEGAGQGLLDAVRRAANQGIVIVVASGNDNQAMPNALARALVSAAPNHLIIAGAVGAPSDGDPNRPDLSRLSSFTNRAGADASRYLSALGYRVRAPDHTGAQFLWSGTSFSTPIISGAAALLASAFPNLTGAQIVEILLSSADDIGAAGVDSDTGRGRLNIAQAFQPRGAVTVAGTSALPVGRVTEGTTSGPMGDAEADLPRAIVLDKYERAYQLDFARTMSRAQAERPLEEGLQQGLSTGRAAAGATAVSITVRRNLSGRSQLEIARTGLSEEEARRAHVVAGHAISRLTPRTAVAFGFSESGRVLQQRLAQRGGGAFLVARDPAGRTGFVAGGAGSLAVRHDLGIAALTVTAEQGEVRQQGPALDFERPSYTSASVTADRSFGPVHATLGVTRMTEQETVLGGRFGFAPAGSASTFLDAGLRYDINRSWGVEARMRNGWTQLPGGNGFVEGGTLATNGWAFDLWRRGTLRQGDMLSFRVTQPLRVSSGGYRLNLPVSYDYATRSVGYELATFNLAPRGREMAFEAAYFLPLFGGAGSLSANTFYRRDPGHIEAVRDDVGAAVRFNLDF